MDIDKIFYKTILKNSFSDPFKVKFWDGEEVSFGSGESKFKIIFNEPLSKKDFLNDPSITFGEAYMYKKIEIEGELQEALESLFNNENSFMVSSDFAVKVIKSFTNTIKKSKENVVHHYDIGNDFYELWLDETMTYTCAYFKTPEDSLLNAQKNKIDHILKKLCMTDGQTILDIGCGWGELILAAAKKYGVKALGVTLSSEQSAKVKERIEAEGLKNLVDVELIDYREIKNRRFDRVLSVGMAENVGKEHINEYFETINKLLHKGGVSMLHTITGMAGSGENTWISKYIFPGGYIPNVDELIGGMAANSFNLLDVESLRRHYALTLEHWSDNFEKALPEIRKTKDEVFIRMWRLYLNSCAANFKSGNMDIHQFLFVKGKNDSLPWNREYVYNQND